MDSDRIAAARQIADAAHALQRARNTHTASDLALRVAENDMHQVRESFAHLFIDHGAPNKALVIGDDVVLINLVAVDMGLPDWARAEPAVRMDVPGCEPSRHASNSSPPEKLATIAITLRSLNERNIWCADVSIVGDSSSRHSFARDAAVDALLALLGFITAATDPMGLASDAVNTTARELCLEALGHLSVYGASLGTHTWSREATVARGVG